MPLFVLVSRKRKASTEQLVALSSLSFGILTLNLRVTEVRVLKKMIISGEALKKSIMKMKVYVWETFKMVEEWRLNQDDGVEGHALTPSCENTRITTGCWTIIDRKTLDFTKEDTPRPRTEEKPQ